MDLQLSGKRALVTGSSSGIGKGIAECLAREGATVITHGRDRERTEAAATRIRAAGGTAHAVMGDLTSDKEASDVVEAVLTHTGGIDILVNNVGGIESSGGAMKPWFDVRAEHWATSMQQNVVGAVRLIHAFAPAMRDRGWGRIINIASANASEPTSALPEYGAAKAAVKHMTVSLCKELARTGVTVNTVSPGCTRTEAFEQMLGAFAAQQGWPEDYDAREKLFMDLGMIPCNSQRYGRPEDIGAIVALIASPISDFINGANYRIDGGGTQAVN